MELMGAEHPVLIGQSGPLYDGRWDLVGALVIGREAGCEIVIPDRQVSRYHARVTPQPDGTLLEDLGSKNGTFCNGKLVEEAVILQDGDIIQVALVQSFVYLSSDATMPLLGGPLTHDSVGRLVLEDRSRRVWLNGQELVPPLSAPQFRMLQLLYARAGNVVSRSELVTSIWDDAELVGVSEEALDALVRRLRDRLAALDASHAYIVTVRGHGLKLDNPPVK
jgi:DNA-binding winged helix-turn-helix (wHTH) protein